jgi:tetratricopeptide (TPR) repeat protein
MTVKEARRIVDRFTGNQMSDDDEVFMFTEAMNFLIEEEHDPADMMYLGGYYYEMQRFDLALKYYELAATYDYDLAFECLGYIWYYGRTGEKDYKKAFEYFSKLMEKGNPVCTYKVADMYKNGYYVEKDQAKYEQIIEDLYPRVKNMGDVFDPIPEVFTRLAKIRVDQGRKEEAVDLYQEAKKVLAERISYNAFFGNLNIMKWLIDDLYELIPFDKDNFDFYDLYYLLKTPNNITFTYEGDVQCLESEMEGNETVVCFNGRWFRSRDDFFKDAFTGYFKLTEIYDQFHDFRVEE